MVAQQRGVLLTALLNEARGGGGVKYPNLVRGLLLHTNDEEAGCAQ